MTDALKPSIEPSEAQLYHNALSVISAIRDSIIGMQSINWSLHVYPLVAALDAAGFEGNGYEVSRAKAAAELQGLRDSVSAEYSPRIAELEAECERLRKDAERWKFGTVLGFPRRSVVVSTGQTAQAWHHDSHHFSCDTAEKAMELAIKKESER